MTSDLPRGSTARMTRMTARIGKVTGQEGDGRKAETFFGEAMRRNLPLEQSSTVYSCEEGMN